MYKLVNVNSKRPIALATSKDLATLWEMLDNPEYKYKTPVIINENGEIVAGHESAWKWAEMKNFNVKKGK